MSHRHPAALNETVSAQMRRMPRASSRPEVALRRELHRRGLRFRSNLATLPGRPDIAFTRARLAVFVDGCFWHACPTCRRRSPTNRAEFWAAKIDENRRRDERQRRQLRRAGFHVMRVWEHEIRRESWLKRLRSMLRRTVPAEA